jgi:rhamnosyltransferase
MKICVCLATFNGQNFIDDFLSSLVSQTYKDFTILFRDDGSTDQTLNILYSYTLKLNIKHLQDELGNLGSTRNFQRILGEASADLYLLADQDDIWDPSKIEKFNEYFSFLKSEELCMPIFIYSDFHTYSLPRTRRRVITEVNNINDILFENIFPGCVSAVNNNLVKLFNRKSNSYFTHDWNLALLCILHEGRFVKIPESLVDYRQHAANQIGHIQKKNFALHIFFNPFKIVAVLLKSYDDYINLRLIGVKHLFLRNFIIFFWEKTKCRLKNQALK